MPVCDDLYHLKNAPFNCVGHVGVCCERLKVGASVRQAQTRPLTSWPLHKTINFQNSTLTLFSSKESFSHGNLKLIQTTIAEMSRILKVTHINIFTCVSNGTENKCDIHSEVNVF